VGKLLEVDGSTVRGWVKSGRLPAFITPGGQYRIDPQAVEDLLAKIGRTVPQPEVAA
jgi:excisionase family DNA binding protein